jgi:hypothetical protein
VGYVYIYNKTINSTSFEREQILAGNAGDLFGTSLAFNQNGEWLYIGAPGTNKMYAYGLNRFISTEKQITSVNDKNTLFFSGNIVANVGDIVTQPATGARSLVTNSTYGSNLGKLEVNTLTNFYYGANLTIANVVVDANVFITSGAYTNDTAVYPTTKSNVSITNSIILNFIPSVPTDPNSLSIINSGKTYIPAVDYVITGNGVVGYPYTVSFISGNIDQSDINDISSKVKKYLNF